MLLELLIIFLTTILVYYLYKYQSVHNHFKKKGLKFLKGVPVFGNLIKSLFLRRHYIDDLGEAYAAFPGERYVGFIEMTKPTILVRDPELMKVLTVKDFEYFTDHKVIFNEDELFSDSLIALKGKKWRDMRTILSPAFSSSKFKLIFPIMIQNALHSVEYLNEYASKAIDIGSVTRRYANDVIATAGFGLQVNSLKDRNDPFFKVGSNLLNFSLKQRFYMMLLMLIPSIAKIIKIRVLSEETYNFFYNIAKTTLEQRNNEKTKTPDLVQLLLENSKEWTPEDLGAQIFIYFAAGFETGASIMTMAAHELALNSEAQEKLYQEIRKHKEHNELTIDNINELKYLDCVVSETLRKWTPAIYMDRVCVKQYELPPPREGGQPYVVNPGDVVLNLVNCLQMDPEHFPEPERFDPDRFSEENKHNIKPFTFVPFGNGPRFCIGRRFAVLEIKVLLYHMVLNFKILKCDKTVEAPRLAPLRFKIAVRGGSWAVFEKRT